MMQAIRTSYKGPTARLGSRVIAKCQSGIVHHVYDDRLDATENHRAACDLLRRKLGWTKAAGYQPMIGGDFDGDTFWVFLPRGTTLPPDTYYVSQP